MASPDTPRPMTLLAVLLLVTTLVYVGSVGNLATMRDSDPAGNALSQAFGVFLTIGLWILLAVLSLYAGLKGDMPGWAAGAAVLLVPASGAAALAAVQLLSDSFYKQTWPIAIPVLVPLLIIGFDLWAYVPSLHRAIPAPAAGSVTWIAVLILSIAPWPAVGYRRSHRQANQARAEVERKAEEPQRKEEERLRNLAAFRRLTPESELREWLEFASPGSELREQALEGIRKLPRRQADAELMMQQRRDFFWDDVPMLDLTPTPVVCERGRSFLQERAKDIQPIRPSDPPGFAYMVDRVEPYLPTMKWLVDHHCECDPELAALEATARIYPDSPERNRFLAALADIRRAK